MEYDFSMLMESLVTH